MDVKLYYAALVKLKLSMEIRIDTYDAGTGRVDELATFEN